MRGRTVRLAEHFAHRGYHDKLHHIPENSLAAFRRAADCGFPVEFDVHLIADGSLVVFHDEELERETGVCGLIEDCDSAYLGGLRLEGTDEKIPALDEVLDIFEDTGLQLLIELKTAGDNYREIAEAVCRRMDSYRGDYVIESFDPRALAAVRRLRPDIRTGQLSQNFIIKREGLPLYQAYLLTNLWLNGVSRPDFIAYRYTDRNNKALRRTVDRDGLPEAVWTIKTPEDYIEARDKGCIPIFENFDPREI